MSTMDYNQFVSSIINEVQQYLNTASEYLTNKKLNKNWWLHLKDNLTPYELLIIEIKIFHRYEQDKGYKMFLSLKHDKLKEYIEYSKKTYNSTYTFPQYYLENMIQSLKNNNIQYKILDNRNAKKIDYFDESYITNIKYVTGIGRLCMLPCTHCISVIDIDNKHITISYVKKNTIQKILTHTKQAEEKTYEHIMYDDSEDEINLETDKVFTLIEIKKGDRKNIEKVIINEYCREKFIENVKLYLIHTIRNEDYTDCADEWIEWDAFYDEYAINIEQYIKNSVDIMLTTGEIIDLSECLNISMPQLKIKMTNKFDDSINNIYTNKKTLGKVKPSFCYGEIITLPKWYIDILYKNIDDSYNVLDDKFEMWKKINEYYNFNFEVDIVD